jgi:hypothetical protein
VDKGTEKSCTVGTPNHRGTDLRRYDGWVEQRVTNGDMVIGHGSNEIALTGGETRIEEHLRNATRIGDNFLLTKKFTRV